MHWPELDGLRALAIALVVARHSLRPFISEDDYAAVATWNGLDLTPFLMNGWVGVDLFFVLSGFLIGRQAFRNDGWGRFWFKRVTRIVPAYWTCLALVALGLTGARVWGQAGWDFAAHLVMLQDYTGSVFVPAFWSLGAEEKFYLLAPVLALALVRVRQPWVQGVALVALWLVPILSRAIAARDVVSPLAYQAYFPSFRSPFHLTCESLVLGFGIAWASVHLRAEVLRPWTRDAVFWSGAVLLLAVLVPATLLGHITWWTIVATPAIVGLGFGAMVLACVSGPGSYSRFLGWAGWRPVALGSFSLYLTHMMVIPLAAAGSRATLGATAVSVTAQWMAFLPWYLALSLMSAWALYAAVERPVLVWRDRMLHPGPQGSPSKADSSRIVSRAASSVRSGWFVVAFLCVSSIAATAAQHVEPAKPVAAPAKPTAAPAKPAVVPVAGGAQSARAASGETQPAKTLVKSPRRGPTASAARAVERIVAALGARQVHSSPLHNLPPKSVSPIGRAAVSIQAPARARQVELESEPEPATPLLPRRRVPWPAREVTVQWPAPAQWEMVWPAEPASLDR